MWTYTRKVKYYETDRMGVVHHSNYLRLLEDARMEWLNDNIMNYNEMEHMGIIIPAVSAECNFCSFLRYDDEFCVEIHLVKFSGVKMQFLYKIYNTQTNVVCFEGTSEHYLAYGEMYKPYLSLRRKYPDLYNKFVNLVEKDKFDSE